MLDITVFKNTSNTILPVLYDYLFVKSLFKGHQVFTGMEECRRHLVRTTISKRLKIEELAKLVGEEVEKDLTGGKADRANQFINLTFDNNDMVKQGLVLRTIFLLTFGKDYREYLYYS